MLDPILFWMMNKVSRQQNDMKGKHDDIYTTARYLIPISIGLSIFNAVLLLHLILK